MSNCKVSTICAYIQDQSSRRVTLVAPRLDNVLQCTNCFNLKLECGIDAENAGAQIRIVVGTETYDMVTCDGNYLRAWQLFASGRGYCQKKLLHCRFCNDPAHIQVRDKLPSSCNYCASIPAATVSAARVTDASTSKTGK